MKETFELGLIVVDRGALDELRHKDIFSALCRFASRDWGNDVSHGVKECNDAALDKNYKRRIFSIYKDSHGTKFFIYTEWDRSATVVIMPDDYWYGPVSVIDRITPTISRRIKTEANEE